MRHSIEWPLKTTSSCVTESFSPAATRICSWIRSQSVIISLTGCSTWMRAFISMNARLPSWSSRNSIVPAPE